MNGLTEALSFAKAGSMDAAREALRQYGLDETILDTWQGMTDVEKDQMDAALNAMSASASGNNSAKNTILQLAGLDTGAVDDYDTVAGRLNSSNLAYQQALLGLQQRYKTTDTGSTRSGGSSSGSGGSSSGSGGSSSGSKSGGYTTSQLPAATTKTPWSTSGTVDGVAGASVSMASPKGGNYNTALREAQQMANNGYNMAQITEYLIRKNYSDSTISQVSQTMGW